MGVVNIDERCVWSGKRHHTLKAEGTEVGHFDWTWMNLRVARASLNGTQYSIRGSFLAFCGFGEWTLCDASDVGLLTAARQRLFISSYTIRRSGTADSESGRPGGELNASLNNDPGTFFSLCPRKSLRCPQENEDSTVASFQCERVAFLMRGMAVVTGEGLADDLFVFCSFLTALQWRTRSGFIILAVVTTLSVTWQVVARVFLKRVD